MAAAHRRRHRAEVHRDVLGLHEQLAVGGEQRGRAVGPLLDVRAERGAAQHRAHLLGDAGEPRDQDLERRRIEHAHRRLQAPVDRRPRQPSGTHTVQSGSAMHRRARPRRRRSTAGSAGRRRAAPGVARTGPQRDHLDRRVGAGVAVAAPCSSWKSSTDAHGELVALARVAAVERRRRRHASPAHRPLGAPGPPARASAVVEPVGAVAGRRPRAHQVALTGAHEQPDRRQHAGARRHDHRGHAQRVGERARVQRPGAAEGDQREARGVDAALDRHRPHAPAPSPRRPPRRHPRRTTPAASSARRGRVAVERGRARGTRRRPGCGRARGRRRSPSARPHRGRSTPARDRRRRSRARRRARRRRRCGRSSRRRRRWCGCRAPAGAPGSRRDRAPGAGSGTPPSTRHTSVLVPPMSNVTASGKPAAAAAAAPARTPPAGPESSSAAGHVGRLVGRAPAHRPTSSPAPRRPAGRAACR